MLDDQAIQQLLKEVDTKDVALALKGARRGQGRRSSATCRRARPQMLREDMEFMGPVSAAPSRRRRAASSAIVRRLEEAGKIVIVARRRHDDELVGLAQRAVADKPIIARRAARARGA